ncbi:AraC family transcriptional regulator [Coraliomargarita sp. SDUM461004]|uniref:AraC family transcriptional regulator n=1 Tax=Thalassobacterium sedimentorum TaxID=3041258 RepID=A0ABU1AH24_9BACT|nr:AraC family transcriptional regulator [Coraliomargarita sp. SDUM461004]MDQ8193488.1 AraC family transcriptional regulator [Coraliomargarita sp. SDUM461004]
MQSYSRYFPSDPAASGWGWRILDAGRQAIASQARYPDAEHPLAYLFDADGRRTLEEFQIVFIEAGSGIFESEKVPRMQVSAGSVFLIFPGEWHRYHPAPSTGWREAWVGFRGADATRVMHQFFQSKQAVLQTQQPQEIVGLFDRLLHWAHQDIAGRDQIAASHIPLILAFLKADQAELTQPHNSDAAIVQRAKAAMLEQLDKRSDLAALAQQLGCSYSRFRFAFKRETGHAPRKFENQIKLNRSRDLLQHNHLSVSETADALGFSSVYYFSRAFKRAFGQSPTEWVKAYGQQSK